MHDDEKNNPGEVRANGHAHNHESIGHIIDEIDEQSAIERSTIVPPRYANVYAVVKVFLVLVMAWLLCAWVLWTPHKFDTVEILVCFPGLFIIFVIFVYKADSGGVFTQFNFTTDRQMGLNQDRRRLVTILKELLNRFLEYQHAMSPGSIGKHHEDIKEMAAKEDEKMWDIEDVYDEM